MKNTQLLIVPFTCSIISWHYTSRLNLPIDDIATETGSEMEQLTHPLHVVMEVN